jgi:hypothetical protein
MQYLVIAALVLKLAHNIFGDVVLEPFVSIFVREQS